MRVQSPSASRPEYFDRNPSSKWNQADVSMGAAARVITVDWSYTVATAKKAYVELIATSIRNDSATGTNATAASIVRFKDTGASVKMAYEARLPLGAATTEFHRDLSGAAVLQAGESIEGVTFSDNTAAGSSVRGTHGFKATEFDA